MSCNKCYKEIKLGDKVKIICTDCFSEFADLEAKLAESELETARWQEHFNQAKLDYQCLKEELAEKEKELEYCQSLLKRSCDECNIKLKTIKTNYAVEQLERVKELVEKRNNGTRQGRHSVKYKDGYSGCSCDVDTIIDQLIIEIKEGK